MNNKSGMGVGSSSIVLVFAVLCLTVFSLISLQVARNNKALTDAEAELVIGYYSADAKAERILAQISESGGLIEEIIDGVEIRYSWDADLETDIYSYQCPISDEKELYIKLGIDGESIRILAWRMRDTGDWEYDGSLSVWIGGSFEEFLLLG